MNLNLSSAAVVDTNNKGRLSGVGSLSRYSFLERVGPACFVAIDLATWWLLLSAGQHIIQGKIFDYSLFVIPSLLTVLVMCLIGSYDRRTDFLSLSYASEHLIGLLAIAVISAIVVYLGTAFQESTKPSRALIPGVFLLFAGVSLFIRRIFGLHLTKMHALRSLLVVGSSERAKKFCKDYLKSNLKWPLRIVEMDDLPEVAKQENWAKVALETGSRHELADSFQYESIILACDVTSLSPNVLRDLVKLHCSNVPVMTVEAFHEKRWRRVDVDAVSKDWLFDSEFRLSEGTFYTQFKRFFDVISSFVALVALIPVFLLLGALIRMGSSGPAIFRQERVGLQGRRFTMYKFRTMREADGEIYTRKGDTRITKLGGWLRKTRLDELPQLWNVLVGDMSLIGPRAEWVKCAEIYEKEIPYYDLRHLVNPGITGWAQVNFSYGESKEDAVEKFQFDLYYIRHFSFLLDVSIVLKTIHIMIGGKGR